jgi:hypothetical protein
MPQTSPQIIDNLVEVINYTNPESDAKQTKQDLINRENCDVKMIPQSELAEKFLNWSWIRWSQKDLDFYEKYLQNSEPINDVYGNNIESEKKWGARFWFDKGLVFPKDKIQDQKSDYQLIKLGKKFEVEYLPNWVSKTDIKLPKGSQGFEVFEQEYKIIWSYDQTLDFYFSDKKIMIPMGLAILTSNNKNEILYLISLLRSILGLKILKLTTGNNENDRYIGKVGVSAIKNFVRVPILDTPQKLEQKQKLIQLAQELLDAETVALQDLVDFDDDRILPARFASWEVVENGEIPLLRGGKSEGFDGVFLDSSGETVVASTIILDSTYKFPIKNQPDLIKQTLEKEIGNSEFSLNQLKNLNVFDKNHQTKIKNQIDELVLGMYQI